MKNTTVFLENSEAFFHYLKSNLENYPIGSTDREIILLLFCIAHKKSSIPQILFYHWNVYPYSKIYTPDKAIALCEKFIHKDLGLENVSFPELIDLLKIIFPIQHPEL